MAKLSPTGLSNSKKSDSSNSNEENSDRNKSFAPARHPNENGCHRDEGYAKLRSGRQETNSSSYAINWEVVNNQTDGDRVK